MILFAITLLALITRYLFHLKTPVWLDEATYLVEAYQYSYKDLFFLNHWDVSHPPLYHVWVKFITTFSFEPLFVRSLGIVLGSLSLIYLYKLTSLLTRSKVIAYLASILGIYSGFLIAISISARNYAPQQFFILTFLYYFYHSFKQKRISFRNYFKVFVTALLATLTDYSFIWVLLTVVTFFLIVTFQNLIKKRSINQNLHLLKLTVISLVPFYLWLPIFVPNFLNSLTLVGWLVSLSSKTWISQLNQLISRMFFLQKTTFPYFVLIIFILVYYLIKALKSKNNKAYWLLFLLLFVPIAGSMAFDRLVSPILHVRNLFVVTYPIIIFVSIILGSIYQKKQIVGGVLVGMILVAQIISIPILINQNTILNPFVRQLPDLKQNLLENDYYQSRFIALDSSIEKNKALFSYFLKFKKPSPNKDVVIYTESDSIQVGSHSFLLISFSQKKCFSNQSRKCQAMPYFDKMVSIHKCRNL